MSTRAGDLSVAPGAVVGGTVNEQLVEREQRRNEYSTFGYYFGQVIRLAGAFVTGLLLLWLFPVLREVSLPNALAVLSSAGIGLAAAVTLPVAAVMFCVTIVGIPLGVLTFLVGAIGLYFSKAVIAQIIGRGVLRNRATPAALRRDAARRPRHRHRRDQPAVDRRPREPRADARGLRRDRELDARALEPRLAGVTPRGGRAPPRPAAVAAAER